MTPDTPTMNVRPPSPTLLFARRLVRAVALLIAIAGLVLFVIAPLLSGRDPLTMG